MTDKVKQPKINDGPVDGMAHLQPESNRWIGVFNVPEDLLEGKPDDWKSVTINYEGTFNCRQKCIDGCGRAKITHAQYDNDIQKVTINVEGTEKPELEEEMKPEVPFRYNPNLPVKKDLE